MTALLAELCAALATGTLQAAGIPAVRHGTVIVYGGRCLCVIAECSGIRSLSALLVIAFLLAATSRPGHRRFGPLLITAAAAAILANTLRIMACVLWPAIHDPVGYLTFGLALFTLLLVDHLLTPGASTP